MYRESLRRHYPDQVLRVESGSSPLSRFQAPRSIQFCIYSIGLLQIAVKGKYSK